MCSISIRAMKIWIATDDYGTKIYITKPNLYSTINNEKEWFGEVFKYPTLLPKNYKQKKYTCKEANIELIL